MALLLGIPGAAVSTAGAGISVKKAMDAVNEAETLFKLEKDPEKRAAALEKSELGKYLTGDQITEYVARDADVSKYLPNAPAPVEGSPAPFRLNNRGRLNLSIQGNREVLIRDGINGRLSYGAAEIEVSSKDGVSQVVIENVDITNKNITNPDELKGKFLRDLAEQYPGYEISWETRDGRDASIRDAALKLVRGDREAVSLREVNGIIGKLMGLEGRYTLETDRKKLPEAVQKDMEAKAAAGFAVKGLSVKADPETGRSVLYIDGAKADATTLPHELMHKYREFASPDMVNRLSAALGLRDSSDGAWLEEAFEDRAGKRKINAHEKLAEYWEDYLAGGDNAAIPEEVKGFFKRLAEAAAKIFEAMGWKRQDIPAELRGIFDEIAGGWTLPRWADTVKRFAHS